MSRGLAAVTGATGFLGQHLVRTLADAGWRVRILARRDPISPFWQGVTPEIVIGDLDDAVALRRLCAGADLVVHAAGLIGGRPADLHRVNVEGSRRLAEAAVSGRFLHISSLAAREPHLSAYAASKRESEDVVRQILAHRATIVRPPAIYGPGDRETLRLFVLAASSPMLPVLDPGARLALVHAEDAAQQAVFLVNSMENGPFTLCDERPEGYLWSEIMGAAAAVFDRRARTFRLPKAALYALAAADGFHADWRRGKAAFTLDKVRELTHPDWGVRPDERALGTPGPRFDLFSGFRQTVGWYRSRGWL